jgi:hypothetical protein
MLPPAAHHAAGQGTLRRNSITGLSATPSHEARKRLPKIAQDFKNEGFLAPAVGIEPTTN